MSNTQSNVHGIPDEDIQHLESIARSAVAQIKALTAETKTTEYPYVMHRVIAEAEQMYVDSLIEPWVTNYPDGSPRSPQTVAVLKFFRFAHLHPHLAAVSRPFCVLAVRLADTLPQGPDLTLALRDLLTAKDNAVRSLV